MMQHDRLEIFISKLMIFFVISSSLLILLGGVLYLAEHHDKIPNYISFSDVSIPIFSSSQWQGLLAFKPEPIILLGFFWMIFGQVVRVVMTAVIFLKERDLLFLAISLIILIIMIHSLIIS